MGWVRLPRMADDAERTRSMKQRIWSMAVAIGLAGMLMALTGAGPASAHEERKIGKYNVEVGFGDEPAYTGDKNSVVMFLNDANDKPVVDLGDTLKVDITTGTSTDDTQKLSMTMQPNFEVGGDGTPGDYRAWFIPTAPGPYTFHFTGSIKGQKVDEKFTSSPTTFDEVQDPAKVEFPAKDPTTGQLSARVDRETQRLNASLRSSDPSSGASLGKAPEKVTLTFTEPPDLTLSTVHVLDSTGRAVESGRAKGVPGKPLVLEVPLGQLPNGAYTVSWRTVSRADGHLTNGSFAFGVGVQAPSATSGGAPAAATSPSPSVLGVAGRWAFDWGLILLVGAVASSLLVFRRREDGPPLPLLGGALALAAAGLAAMIVAEHSRVGVAFGDLLGSPTGSKLINQAVVLAVTALVLGAVARWPRRPELLVLLGVAAAATMLVHVAGGHAAGEATLTPLNVLVQWAHLLAVGVWVGGFLWLLLGLRGAGAAGSGPEPGNGSQATMRPEPP